MAHGKSVDISLFRSLYPFESNFLDINGFKYHYLDEGAGEPILMVHGNPTWSFYYRRLVTALSPDYRTIVPDHIGCGLSDKPAAAQYDYRLKNRLDDLTAFIDRLNISRPITLVLHDWGGMIGMAYGAANPGRIARIVLMNTAAFLPPHGKVLPFRLRLVRNYPFLAIPAVLGLNLFVLGALRMATHKGLSLGAKTGLIAPYNSLENRIAVLKFVQDIPLEERDPSYALVKSVGSRLRRLSDMPMMICWGAHDFVFDKDYLAEWQKRFPRAEVHYFENAGHYVLEDEPEAIISRISDFLKRHPI